MIETECEYTLAGSTIPYILRRHNRARRSRITLYPDGRIAVTIPMHATELAAKRILNAKGEWLKRNLAKVVSSDSVRLPKLSTKEKDSARREARTILTERVKHFACEYNFSFGRIAIKDQKHQWGSCSAKKNLNFNYRLVLLPEKLRDYVVVHELCHLQELNHSKRFWDLVESIIPGSKKLDKELKRYVIS